MLLHLGLGMQSGVRVVQVDVAESVEPGVLASAQHLDGRRVEIDAVSALRDGGHQSATAAPRDDRSPSTSTRRRILPLADLGSESTISMRRTRLYGATRCATNP